MDRITQYESTKSATLPLCANCGTSRYNTAPSTKNTKYVFLRPIQSDADAHTKRPPMLKSESSPTKPAAAAAVIDVLKLSWIITDACPSTPIPAVTLRNSTSQIR